MVNKTVLCILALTFAGSSLAVFTPPATAAPILDLECHRLKKNRDRNLCFTSKLNIFQKDLATYYCKKLYGPRSVAIGSINYKCDLRNVVDHR
jgi:hypothetical protein